MNKFLRAEPGGAKNFSPLPNTISSLSLSAGKLAVSDILAHYNASLTLDTYAHIAATVADYLGVKGNFSGSSFLPDILG